MLVLIGLLPALVLLGAAFLMVLPLPFATRYRRFVPLIANALALAALLFLSTTRREPITLFEPSDILPNLTLTLLWNGSMALPFGIILLFILSARFLMDADQDMPLSNAGMLVVEGGALLFFAATNWTTVAAAWLWVEFGLLIVPTAPGESRERVGRAFAWNLAAIILWLTAGMMVANEAASLQLVDTALQATPALLVFLAVWIRCGLYPFQAASPASAESFGVRIGVPILLGGYLMARLLVQLQGAMDFSIELQLIALCVVGFSGLLVAGQPHGAGAFDWALRTFAAPLLLLPFFYSTNFSPALAVWLTLGAFAVSNVVGVAWLWRAQLPHLPLNAFIWIFALVLAATLPFSPGFTGRVGFLAAAYGSGHIALWLLLVATIALTLIPVWREILASRESAPKAPTVYEYAAFACLLLPSLAVAFLPMLFVAPLGITAQAGMKLFADSVLPSGSRLTDWVFLLAGIFMPVLAAFELARRWERRVSLLPGVVADILDLSGVFRSVDVLYRLGRTLLQRTLTVLEQPPIAWLIFCAIWVAVWLRGLGT